MTGLSRRELNTTPQYFQDLQVHGDMEGAYSYVAESTKYVVVFLSNSTWPATMHRPNNGTALANLAVQLYTQKWMSGWPFPRCTSIQLLWWLRLAGCCDTGAWTTTSTWNRGVSLVVSRALTAGRLRNSLLTVHLYLQYCGNGSLSSSIEKTDPEHDASLLVSYGCMGHGVGEGHYEQSYCLGISH